MEWTARLHLALFGVVVMLGALAGAGLAVLYPPMLSSHVLVVVQASKTIQTQALIADSNSVLAPVSESGPLSYGQLLRQVKVAVSSSTALTITVSAKTADDAERAADAVAQRYVTLVSSPDAPGRPVLARVVASASPATGTTQPGWVAGFAMLGALAAAGAMIMWRPVLPT
jgi:hypothetical protein